MQFSSSKVQFSSYVADKIRLCNRNAYTHDVANIFRCLSYSTVTTVIELSTYRSSPAFNAAVTAVPEASPTQLFYDIDVLCTRDDQYPVCRLDIQQDSEFATGYGYPKSALKREPDTDPDIRNAFIRISETLFCLENELTISDKINLPADSFTYVSDTHGTCSWLDHVVKICS